MNHIDPVCGMSVSEHSEHHHSHGGEEFYFCSAGCLEKFSAEPGKYLQPSKQGTGPCSDESCDIVYHFEHNKKVKRIYVNAEMKQHIIQGKLGIARIEGRYELVTKTVAEKIQQRNEKRIVIFSEDKEVVNEDDPYAEHKIPDDLMW